MNQLFSKLELVSVHRIALDVPTTVNVTRHFTELPDTLVGERRDWISRYEIPLEETFKLSHTIMQ